MIISDMLDKKYLFGAIRYQRAGACSILLLFGSCVYMRVGDGRWLLGFMWNKKGKAWPWQHQ